MENRSRRRVLTAGLAGTVATLAGRRAEADAPASVPPGRPSEADRELLGFAQQFELAARDLYEAAIAEGAAGDEDRVLQACHDNHQASADALSGLLGNSSQGRRADDVFDEWVDLFTSSSLEDVAAAGYDLESVAVATHTDLIGQLEGVDGTRTIAAVLTMQARMCVVLADLSGRGDDFDALFTNEADALSPTTTAIEGRADDQDP